MGAELTKLLTRMQLVACAMYFYDGSTQEEIAAFCGTTQPAIAMRIRRAQEKLKRAGLPPMRKLYSHPAKVVNLDPEIARSLL